VKQEMLAPVLKALRCQEDLHWRVEAGELVSYGVDEGEVLVDCLHAQGKEYPEEIWQLATLSFRSLQTELKARADVQRVLDELPATITPPPQHLDDFRTLTDAYRRFRQARTQLLRLQRHVLTLVDQLEAARVQQGQRRLQQPCPPTRRTRSRR
jgi:hypothetical protein